MPDWLTDIFKWFGALSEFWAAIAGAIVGGLISLGLQLIATSSARKEREAERREYRRGVGYGTLSKVIRIQSDFFNYNQHIENAFRQAPENRHDSPSQFVNEMASYPPVLEFTHEEIGFVLSLGDVNLLNDVNSLGMRHRTIIHSFMKYDEIRSELGRLLELDHFEGTTGTVFDEEEIKRHAPKSAVLDHMIKELRVRCERFAHEARNTVNMLQAKLEENEILKIDLQHKFDLGRATIGKQ